MDVRKTFDKCQSKILLFTQLIIPAITLASKFAHNDRTNAVIIQWQFILMPRRTPLLSPWMCLNKAVLSLLNPVFLVFLVVVVCLFVFVFGKPLSNQNSSYTIPIIWLSLLRKGAGLKKDEIPRPRQAKSHFTGLVTKEFCIQSVKHVSGLKVKQNLGGFSNSVNFWNSVT